MRPLALLLLLLAMSAVGPAGTASAEELRTEEGHLVRWDSGLGHIGREVVERLPGIRAHVARKLGAPFPAGSATIVVARDLASMRTAARAQVPEWAAGVCIGQRSLIVLRADRIHPPTPARSTSTVLRHEWVHLAWARQARFHVRSLPLWLEEGLAEEIGGGVSVDAGAALDYAAAWGDLIPLTEIATRFPAQPGRAGLAYRQGASWARFFIREQGWDGVRAILAELARGAGGQPGGGGRSPFDQVLRQQTGEDLASWSARWQASLEEEARPWFHLLGHDIGWTLIILISVVSLWLFFSVRRKRRRAIEALPDG